MAVVRRLAGQRDARVTMSTGTWTLVTAPVDGLTCYAPTIVVRPSANDKNRLNTHVHEALHASNQEMSEEEVTRIADDVTELLWKAGYRHP